MIFVTVGTDLPFDRLIKAVDAWAEESNERDIFAQIGEGGWHPRHIEFKEFMEPPEFNERFAGADVIVAHAGMGTILTALNAGKGIIVMPRIARLGEHRNEHQLATAKRMSSLGLVVVADNEKELVSNLCRLDQIRANFTIGKFAEEKLIMKLRSFISHYG